MNKDKLEKAVFGAGCFWHVELEFSKVNGVKGTRVGYMGGDDKKYSNPSYEMVCSDKTGHAEVVEVTFDPKKVKYEKLLDVFWKNHDPTQLNRQGPDVGTQYRSVIFYYTEKQKEEAIMSRDYLQKKLGPKRKIVTQIVKANEFHLAEEYHQKYLGKKGLDYCRI